MQSYTSIIWYPTPRAVEAHASRFFCAQARTLGAALARSGGARRHPGRPETAETLCQNIPDGWPAKGLASWAPSCRQRPCRGRRAPRGALRLRLGAAAAEESHLQGARSHTRVKALQEHTVTDRSLRHGGSEPTQARSELTRRGDRGKRSAQPNQETPSTPCGAPRRHSIQIVWWGKPHTGETTQRGAPRRTPAEIPHRRSRPRTHLQEGGRWCRPEPPAAPRKTEEGME